MPGAGSVLADLVSAMAARPEVRRVVLFGSRARGDADDRSDIDLAVEAPSAPQRVWLDLTRVAEEADTLLKIDLVRLEETSEELRAAILAEGKVLYERSEGGPEPS